MTKEITTKKVAAENAFANGALISTRIRSWQGSAKLPEDMKIEVDGLDIEQVRAVYDLLKKEAKEYLSRLVGIRGKVKNFLKANAIPFPHDNLEFIRKSRIEIVNERMVEYQKEYFDTVDHILENYLGWIEDFAAQYPKAYNAAKYPSLEALRARFVFQWSFRVFTVPDKELGILSADMYKQEKAKFDADITQMKKDTLAVVGKSLMERVEMLKKQCDNEKISTSTLQSVTNLLEKVNTVYDGFVDNEALKKMLDEVRVYTEDVDAEMLKIDEGFRDQLGKKMEEVANELTNLPDVELLRSLDI